MPDAIEPRATAGNEDAFALGPFGLLLEGTKSGITCAWRSGEMANLSAAMVAASHDPLVIAFVILAMSALLAHLWFRRHAMGRAIARVISLICLIIVLVRVDGFNQHQAARKADDG
jgi:hypothetical protein